MFKKVWRKKEFQWAFIPPLVACIMAFTMAIVIQNYYPIVVEISGVRYVPYLEIYPLFIVCVGLLPSVFVAANYISKELQKES